MEAVLSPVAPTPLGVSVGTLHLNNPVMPASGCFGPELAPLMSVPDLGAVVTKTVFAERRAGNPAHRLTETAYGMLNSVGIPSPGSIGFRDGLLRQYQEFGVPVIVSIGGLFTKEYFRVAEDLQDEDIAAFEINVSCPNLEEGGLAMGTSPRLVAEVVAGIYQRVNRPLIVKLTPSVTSIADIALAAQDAGAAAVTVCNSFSGLAINIDDRSNALGNGAGGYTGPALKPLALRLVRDAAQAVQIPVIGCGGISSARDVAEFLIAGASAIQVGTATFTRPHTMAQIIADLGPLCQQMGVERIADLIGTLDASNPSGRIA